jgi:hypothetical protein
VSSNIKFKFLQIPSPTNSVSFDYTYAELGTQSVDFTWVNSGEKSEDGQLEISTQSVVANYDIFIESFISLFNTPTEVIEFLTDDVNLELTISSLDGEVDNLVVNNFNNSFTYSLNVGSVSVSNLINLTLNSLPNDGDSLSFGYYPNYPNQSVLENIELVFESGLITSTGEIPISATLSNQYELISQYFNQYYNGTGEWSTEIETIGLTTSIIIHPNNLSTLIEPVITGGSIEIEEDQIPSDTIFSDVLVRSSKFVYSSSGVDTKSSRFTINFTGQPSEGTFYFQIERNSGPLIYYAKNYSNSDNDENNILIGSTLQETVNNTLDNFETYNSSEYVSVVYSKNLEGTKIYLDVISGISDIINLDVILNGSGSKTISGPLTTPLEDNFDACKFDLYVWEGNITETLTTPLWTSTKQIISEDQTRLYLDFSRLSNDNFNSNIKSYLSTTAVQKLPSGESKWGQIRATNQLLGVNREDRLTKYFLLNGWTESTSHIVPQILLSGSKTAYTSGGQAYNLIKRYYHKNSINRIFYKTNENFGYTVIQGNLDTIVVNGMSGDNTESREVIKSLDIPRVDNSDNDLGNKIEIPFDYFTGRRTIVEVELYDECKFPLVDIIFKNRYGVLETVSMGKLSRTNLNTNREDFTRSVVDINGLVNTSKHSTKNYNINGREEWVVNTGHIPEYMNDPIEELFLSDEVWLIDYSKPNSVGNEISFTNYSIIPVTLKDSDFNRLKHITDGLINYTFNFETSHQKISSLI